MSIFFIFFYLLFCGIGVEEKIYGSSMRTLRKPDDDLHDVNFLLPFYIFSIFFFL